MPLPINLNDHNLMFQCEGCGHPIIRKGSWIKVAAKFKCPGCNAVLQLGYPQKLHIFAAYEHLAGKPAIWGAEESPAAAS